MPDGRTLGMGETGVPTGFPVFYFHGFPGSRLEAKLLESAARELGVRILALERPGYGISDFQPGRAMSEWPRDVLMAARHLGLERFAVLGVSGGGPYALACAAALPQQVSAAATVGGLGPLHLAHGTLGMSRQRRLGCSLLRLMRWLTRPAYALLAKRMRRQLQVKLAELLSTTCPRDQATIRQPGVEEILKASYTEALRRDARGGARDLRLYLSPWDFEVGAIRIPTSLWHGAADKVVPAGMSESLGRDIPTAEALILPEEGHYSLPINFARPILERLLVGAV